MPVTLLTGTRYRARIRKFSMFGVCLLFVAVGGDDDHFDMLAKLSFNQFRVKMSIHVPLCFTASRPTLKCIKKY